MRDLREATVHHTPHSTIMSLTYRSVEAITSRLATLDQYLVQNCMHQEGSTVRLNDSTPAIVMHFIHSMTKKEYHEIDVLF